MHDILSAVEADNTIHAVVLDFSKAFDRVPHSLLMRKLLSIEDMDDYLVHWIHDFLSDRTQPVVLNRTHSGSKPVASGIPQG